MKYYMAFLMVAMMNITVPYLVGPILAMNENRLERWGWLAQTTEHSNINKMNPDELRFT